MSQLRVPVPELGINNSKPYRKFKTPLISLMIVKNGRNKLFHKCKSIFNKGSRAKHSPNQRHNFTGVYPSPVLMNLDARNVSYSHFCLSNVKKRLFSHVSVIFNVIQNEWLATNCRHGILNNFEEYYIM